MKPRVFLSAITSGALLWVAFFPLDLGALGFVALVPWLTLVRAPVSNRRRYFAAYSGGVLFFALAANWVRVAHPMMVMSWIGLAVVMPVFWLGSLAILRRLDKLGVPLALAVPVAWVAFEYVRMHFPTGFPFMKSIGAYQMIGFGWYYLGYTQHAFLPLIQIADLGGVYAVSFVVGAVNGALAEVVLRSVAVRRWLRWSEPTPLPEGKGEKSTESPETSVARAGSDSPFPSGRGAGGVGLALALLVASVGYGFWRLDHPAFADGPRVAAIQGSVPQFEKMKKGKSLEESYGPLNDQASNAEPTPDLVVWPETCFPADWLEIAPGAVPSAEFRLATERCQKLYASARPRVPVLLGLTGLEWDDGRAWKYNSALLLDTHGAKLGRYDKMHLVPFGEYVPLENALPFMKWFTPYKHDYACRPGQSWTRFPLKARDGRDFTFGVLICYEDSDPYLARQYVSSAPVNFLVNISNDGWFDGTEEHEQHLAICRFRAIEARRAIVRSVNMGISGFVDSDGRVIALPDPDWSKSKKVEAVVTAVVPLDARSSTYATLGDWVPALCWFLALAGAVAGWVRPKPV